MKQPSSCSVRSISSIPAILSLSIVLLSPRASAVVYYWDPNGLAVPTSGIWDTTTPQWSTTSALTATPVVWDPTAAAGFPAGAANISLLTISINSSIGFAGIFNGVSGFGVTNLAIIGSGSLSLNSGLQGFSTAQSYYNTIVRIPISGPGGLQNQAGGSLYLSGINTYSGGTSLGTSAGLNFNNGNAFGSGQITNAVTTTVLATPATDSAGGTFANAPITIPNSVATFGGAANSSLIYVGIAAAPAIFTGPWTLANGAGFTATLQNQPAGTTVTISGPISGAANFAKSGAGTLVLSGANTYTGKTLVNNSVLNVNSLNKVVGGNPSSSLGAPTTVANGTINLGATTTSATLLYTGPGETTDRVINLAGTTGGGVIQNDGTGPLVFTADMAASGLGAKTLTLRGANTGNNIVSGKIANSTGGNTSVTKSDGGTWTLAGANTYSGNTTLNTAGLLNLANASALGTGTLVIGGNGFLDNTSGADLTIANGITCSGGSPTYAGSANNITINGPALITGANRTITVSARTLTLGSTLGDSGQNRNFQKAGAGTLVLLGAASYGGSTIVNNGTLTIGGAAQLSGGNYLGTIINTNGGTFNYASSAAQTLSGVISGTGALVQNGPGILTLAAANTYSGPTTVAAASLDISASSSLIASPVTVATGATLQLDSNTALGSAVNLLLNSGSPAVNLNYIGTDQIQLLSFDGGATFAPGGIYGSIGSGATFQDPRFTGPGLLAVLSQSATSVSPSANPATYGDTVTLTASATGAGPTPTGTVTFKEGATTLGAQILDGAGSAILSTNGFSAGSHSITVVYSGDVNYAPSTSLILALVVNKAALSITANNQTKVYGQTLTFSSGNTAFSSTGLQNGETIGTVTLGCAGGVATAPVSSSPYLITPSAATGGTFSANNYAITYNTGNLTVTPATLNVTATGLLVYGFDPTNAVYVTQYAPLQGTDSVAAITGSAHFSTDATSSNYVGSNYIAHVLDTGTLNSPNYTFVPGPDGILSITNRPLRVTNVLANNRVYDGTTAATVNFTGAGLDNLVNGDDAFVFLVTSDASATFPNKNVGTNKAVTVTGLSIFGDLGTNYFLIQPTTTSANISQLSVTVTAAADTKYYDGTTSSAGLPVSTPPLASGDTGNFLQTFDNKNAGSAKTLTPSGSIDDGNGGANYALTLAPISTGAINPKAISVTAVSDSKIYDGTIASTGIPNVSPALISGDTPNFSQFFNDKNVGSGKSLIPTGSVNDGNSGANYSVTFVNDTSGVITATSITVTAFAATKVYDGTTNSVAVPTVSPGLAPGDAPEFSEAYDSKNVGVGKTLTPSGSVRDGNGGANYSVTYVSNSSGVITTMQITVTAVAATKIYDGTIGSSGVPTIVPFLAVGDISTFSQTYDTKDVGIGKTLIPGGLVNDGNSGANYSVTFVSDTNGVISAKATTVSAVATTKVYDGTITSGGNPTISPPLALGDSGSFSQTYDTKHIGTGKTLTPTGSVNDGNAGANYSITLANDTNGVISAKPITVTAVSATKVYDGTTGSGGTPTISPSLAIGDTATFSQTYNTKHVGTGKTLTPTGLVNDGNSGANYSVTFANDTTGVITAKPISVTAVATTKVYDGTTSSAGDPTIAPFLAVGDIANFSQTYDTKNVGTGKTLTPSGSVIDGNSGANYTITFFNNPNGVITWLTTTNVLVSSVNPSAFGSNVTFTATVTGVPAAPDFPTGQILFFTASGPFATNNLVNGSCSASLGSLPVGTNAITATYFGDNNYAQSSGTLNQVVTNSVIYSTTNIILSIASNNNGTFTLNLLGTPGAQYYIVSSPDVALPMGSWTAIGDSTNTASNPSGLWLYRVVVSNDFPAFFRSVAIHPAP
jgi:autotransporter-associated beta strand protein